MMNPVGISKEKGGKEYENLSGRDGYSNRCYLACTRKETEPLSILDKKQELDKRHAIMAGKSQGSRTKLVQDEQNHSPANLQERTASDDEHGEFLLYARAEDGITREVETAAGARSSGSLPYRWPDARASTYDPPVVCQDRPPAWRARARVRA